MDTLSQSVVRSLDGSDDALLPFLPYLLQDLWEIGTPADIVVDLLRRYAHVDADRPLRVLDLGCGKGAVAVPLARELGCSITGIDAVPAFLEAARQQARVFGVEDRCTFQVGDIRQRVEDLRDYDVVVLGAIGPVLGGVGATLRRVRPCLAPGGYVVLDDGYLPDDSAATGLDLLPAAAYRAEIAAAGFEVVHEVVISQQEMRASDAAIYRCIEERADELAARYPEKQHLLEAYLEEQEAENQRLEEVVQCAVFLLRKRHSGRSDRDV